MGRKNRDYKKGKSHRDARLFVIICEGAKREKAYFDYFKNKIRSLHIDIEVLAPGGEQDDDAHKSAPKYLLERAANYEKNPTYSQNDLLWFVFDVDNWKKETIYELIQYCKEKKNWNMAISNPCFEVWLYLHYRDISNSQATNCQGLKQELATLVKGGYKVEIAQQNLDTVIIRAKAIDSDPNAPIPAFKTTRIYQLMEQMSSFLSKRNNISI